MKRRTRLHDCQLDEFLRSSLASVFCPSRLGALCFFAFVISIFSVEPAAASGVTQAELMVRPEAVDPEAIAEAGGLPDQEAVDLLIEQLMLEKALDEGTRDRQLEELLGKHRCRQLDRALFMFDLHAPELGRDPRDDPRFEDARDAVFSAWKKIQRERLEDALGIEAWWDRKREGMRRSLRGGEDGAKGSAISLRISPRLSEDAVGLKFGLRGTGSLLDHMTFRFVYELDESHPVFILNFEDRLRFLDINFAPGTPEFGDRFGLGLRYSW